MIGIFSGNYLIGKVGEPTQFKDYKGEDLFIGDIVLCFYNEHNIGFTSHYMTVICNNDFISYSNGIIVQKNKEDIESAFVMGIKDGDMAKENEDGELLSGWVLQKIKDYKDIVEGEHWKCFGINYKNIDNIEMNRSIK